MKYASVRILNLPVSADKSYEYHIPLHLEGKVMPGSIVIVPFGGANSAQLAVTESVSDKKKHKNEVKPIFAVSDKLPCLNDEMLSLCKYMTDMTLCSMGEAVKCILPSGYSIQRTVYYSVNTEDIPGKPQKLSDSKAMAILEYLRKNGKVSKERLERDCGFITNKTMKSLIDFGLCNSEDGYECKINEKCDKYVELCDEAVISEIFSSGKVVLSVKQLAVYDALASSDCPMSTDELMNAANIQSLHSVKELEKKGIIRVFEIDADRSRDILTKFEPGLYGDFELSEEQTAAFDKLYSLYREEKANAALLWGVTGSGKTNVLLKLIDKVLADGRTVIVLVPEIALTSQTVGRFTARYSNDGIALLHSGLSAGERNDAKKRIAEGKAKIVIGTRSAVFAPVVNPGLIIMDEEHEGSFKSDKSPKYHARDIARFRCAYNNALLVMASATPLAESFYRAETGRYHLVKLLNRYGSASLPEVSFYDMKNEPYFVMPEDRFEAGKENTVSEINPEDSALPLILGKQLTEEIASCLEKKEQAMLFINRRGYRAFALCRSCGYTFNCPHCSVSMTHHKDKRTGKSRMQCHYCGHIADVPEICPECGKKRISFVGSGTQLLEETLNRQFPEARVLRMDADTTSGKFAHEKILTDFRNGKADILVGTQMIAKGHDFPGVSLVGVALADTSLFVNDFRANEKTFSLLTQVLGRAGRGETPGKAVLQTYVPDNEVLSKAASQDYESFYRAEIAFRKANVFPPFCDIVTINLSSSVENDLVNAVRAVHGEIDSLARSKFNDVKFILFGPFKNEIYRIAGKFRMRFIIKCRNNAKMREMLAELLKKTTAGYRNVTFSVDINPTNL